MNVFFLVLLGFYVLYIVLCAYAWNRKKPDRLLADLQLGMTVVVAAKNEEKNIGRLLNQLRSQIYKPHEIIVVDDGSTDRTREIVATFPQVRLIPNCGTGKKMALKCGIESASTEVIVCTDADCALPSTWLASIATGFRKYDPSLMILPVRMSWNGSFWQRIQAVEFMSLAAVTAGSALLNRPVMCNGANLAFKKKVWLEAFEDICLNEPSGDDMFFLMSCVKRKLPICYLKSKAACVSVTPSETPGQFFRQRRRWVSKSKSYTDPVVIALALLTAIVTLVPLYLVCTAQWKEAAMIWGVKSVVDFCFLSQFASFFETKKILYIAFPLAVIYPFYVGYVSFSSVFTKRNWK